MSPRAQDPGGGKLWDLWSAVAAWRCGHGPLCETLWSPGSTELRGRGGNRADHKASLLRFSSGFVLFCFFNFKKNVYNSLFNPSVVKGLILANICQCSHDFFGGPEISGISFVIPGILRPSRLF